MSGSFSYDSEGNSSHRVTLQDREFECFHQCKVPPESEMKYHFESYYL